MIDTILVQVATYVAQLSQYIANFATQQIQAAINWVNNLASGIFTRLNSLVTSITNWIQGIYQSISQWTGTLVQNIQNYVGTAMQRLTAFVDYALNGVQHLVNSIVSKVQATFNSLIDGVKGFIQSVVDWVKSLVKAGIDAVQAAIAAVIGTVQTWIQSAIGFVVNAYNTAVAKINQGIDALIGGAKALIDGVAQRLGDLKEAFTNAALKIVEALGNAGEKPIKDLTKNLEKLIEPYVKILPPAEMARTTQDIKTLLEGKVGLPAYHQHIATGLQVIANASPTIAAIFTLLIVFQSIGAAQNQLAAVYMKPIIQEIAATAPYEILSPIDIAAAWRRGYVDEKRAIEVIKRQGYTVDDATVILRLADTVPSEFELVAMELRGIITPAETNEALKVRGLDESWAAKIRAMGQIIPPVGDLITMAVREAFSPDIAQRFGQYEGFPKDFADWAAKQGLSPEWAQRYWAAHWSLPSPMQGFEMFQRRIIGKEDLVLLLRALDIMPFWRERLIELSYNPLTRVDVRRMHQLGVLNDADVYNSYLDIGYSPENAKRLQDFTLKLNQGQQPLDDEELGRLTRTQVLNFYEAGLIDQQKTIQYLVDMGITPDAAVLYVRASDANEQLAIRKADADFIVEQAQAGILSFDAAQDQLNNMGLEPVEVQRAVNKLVRLLATRTKLPTRTEAEQMWVKGLISEPIYRDLLGRLGYAEHWVNAYVALVKDKLSANKD